MENHFIKLNLNLLQRTDLSPIEKIILSILESYQKDNKYFYAGQSKLSEMIGVPVITIKRTISNLESKKIIFQSQDKKYLIPFQNRKAIILVDDNNPIPKAETKAGQEISQESTPSIREEIKEPKAKEKGIDNPTEPKVEEESSAIAETKAGQEIPQGSTQDRKRRMNDIFSMLCDNKGDLLPQYQNKSERKNQWDFF